MPVNAPGSSFCPGLRPWERRPSPAGESGPRFADAIDTPLTQVEPRASKSLVGTVITFNPGFRQGNLSCGLVGVTKDEDTAAITPGVKVDLFEAARDAAGAVSYLPVASTTSDADGKFIFTGLKGYPAKYLCLGYLVGAPDFSGASLNTLEAKSNVYPEA